MRALDAVALVAPHLGSLGDTVAFLGGAIVALRRGSRAATRRRAAVSPMMGRTVTKALERAFRAASSLPEAAQDALAAAILEEVSAEEHSGRTLERNEDALARLADEALADETAGRTKPLDPDSL